MDILKMKKDVLDYSQLAYREQMFAGTSGNLSIYDRESGLVAITPSTVSYATMTVEDIMVIKLDGEIVEGKHRPSSEWNMHVEIYKAREDISSVVHTHSPYATSFAVSNEPIPVILIEMIPFLHGGVDIAKFGLPGTPSVGTEALKVLNGHKSCLLQNHGVLTIGDNIAQAYVRALYVEDAAKIYHYAKLNGNVNLVSEEDIAAMRNRGAKK